MSNRDRIAVSWWDKADRWWQTGHGLRVQEPALKAYRVVLSDKPDATVYASSVETAGGELRFMASGKVVASWPQGEVVGWSAE